MIARGLADAAEQCSFGRGHPNLSAAFETAEQGRPALGVEVRRDLVEKQDGRFAASFGNQLGMGKNEAEEQRFLLARG